MIERWVSCRAWGHGGQPVREVFRRVDPPRAVLVDLGALFPRQPHYRWGRYHPFGLQMHKVVAGELTCWGLCEQGAWWGLVTYSIHIRDVRKVGDALDSGVDADCEALIR